MIEIKLPYELISKNYKGWRAISSSNKEHTNKTYYNNRYPVILKKFIRKWLRANIGIDGFDYHTYTILESQKHFKNEQFIHKLRPVIQFYTQKDATLFKLSWF